MSVKLILCPFRGEPHELNGLAGAVNLAKAEAADVRVLHVARPQPAYTPAFGVSRADLDGIERTTALQDLVTAEEKRQVDLSRQQVRDLAARSNITFCDDVDIELRGTECDVRFRARVGQLHDILPRESQTCDLIAMGYDTTPGGSLSAVLAALYHTRRPVLLTPNLPGAGLPATGRPRVVAIGWDESRACAEAIRGAMPFLVMAASVFVLRVADARDIATTAAEMDTRGYLASHGVAAEFIHSARGKAPVGELLLARAGEAGAQLLVMGAYGAGHGHLSEMVLGGATDHVLKHARMPLLLAH